MSRAIPRSVAAVIEQLELDGDLLVTTGRLAATMRQVGIEANETAARRVAYELQREGWLGPLRTRHVWEFLPGARGGAYGSGDRFIEFRAQLAVNPSWPGVLAMDSAASVLGLAQRVAEQEVVALPANTSFPKALTGEWRYVQIELSQPGLTTINGLPSWNIEGLLVGIAARPSAYKDVAGLGQWLAESVLDVDKDTVISLLKPMHRTTAQRVAYLLGAAGNDDLRAAVLATYPANGTAWLGPRIAGQGVFDTKAQVNDTLLHRYLNVGTGS